MYGLKIKQVSKNTKKTKNTKMDEQVLLKVRRCAMCLPIQYLKGSWTVT